MKVVPVVVYDYSALPDPAFERSLAEAQAIFAEAGVSLAVSHCRALPSGESACTTKPDARLMRVRLFDGTRRGSHEPRANSSGYAAFDSDGSGYLATLFFAPIERLAWRAHVPPERVLGRVMAHELAHLLLGPGAHTEQGLMRTRWGSLEAAAARAHFTGDECARLRAAAEALAK